jgi:D-glycero-alpha-D-manno-heptose-7-phosphate kinase
MVRTVKPTTGRMSLIFAIVSPMIVLASAPARIDLAGGTLDIWPVCHALEHPAVTVNLAINLRAEARVEQTGDGHLEVISEDLDERVRLPVDEVTHERLGLATRLAAWFVIGEGLRIHLRSRTPPHSGLGGSSSMGVALAGALARLRDRTLDLRAVQDLETAELKLPTGYQDYFPALLGGLNTLTAAPGGPRFERLEGGEEFLSRHLRLANTQVEHRSGPTNWDAVKRFLDGDAEVVKSFESIARSAGRMRSAVHDRDLDGVAAAMNTEWTERRRLSPLVSNERIEALSAAALEAGALATKICGAGGGGCMVLLVPEEKDHTVARAVEAAGGAMVDFRPDPDGLRIE